MTHGQFDALLCAVLRDENPSWPVADDPALVEAFLARTEYHGVLALLHERLNHVNGWPAVILQRLRERAIGQAMWEMRHQQVLVEVLANFANAGTQPVLFKGTALAYSLYGNPVLRARGDTDLIVSAADKARVIGMLEAGGFMRAAAASRVLSSYQTSYTLGDHTLDLHWRINDSELLSQLFTYDELREQATPLPALSPAAWAPGPVHAMLLACLHRAMHMETPYYSDGVAYFSGNRLIWLYDIHLLAQAMTAEQWEDFAEIADRKGLRAICLDAIERTQTCFNTTLPDRVRDALTRPGPTEIPTAYLNANIARRHWLDFRAMDGIGSRLDLLREVFFPSAGFIRGRFPDARIKWLPWLYARRLFEGVRMRLQRQRRTP